MASVRFAGRASREPIRAMTGNNLLEQDQAERNTRWIVFSRLAVASYFLGVTVFLQFRAVGKLPADYLWISYSLIFFIYAFSILCLVLPRSARQRPLTIIGQSVFDVVFVTGIVLLTGGIDSVYSVLYSLVVIYSTLFLGRRGGLSIAAMSSLCYMLIVSPELSGIFQFLYDEGIVLKGELSGGYILTRVSTHVASFFIMALLTSFVVEQERKTKRMLAEKATTCCTAASSNPSTRAS